MKKAIYTIMLGHDPAFAISRKRFQEYADKVGADLHVCTKARYSIGPGNILSFAKAAWLEILYVQELLKSYDRVLYIDADILITPDAKNIFEQCPDLETTYLFNEGAFLDCQHYHDKTNKFYAQPLQPMQEMGRTVYFNTGVVLTSSQAGLFPQLRHEDLQHCYGRIPLYQQTHINRRILQDQFNVTFLPNEFNRMEYMGERETRFEASFIHYAGDGYSLKRRDRSWQLIEDYERLYYPNSGKLSTRWRRFEYCLRFAFYRVERLWKRLIVRPLHNPMSYFKSKRFI